MGQKPKEANLSWADQDEQEENAQTKSHYVIFDGPFRGNYLDWYIVSNHVRGTRNTHKKYPTKEEAENALAESYKTMVKSDKPKEQKPMLVMKNPGGIRLTDIPTTVQKQELKKLTEEKMEQMEKMMIEYKDINRTMRYYPRKIRNGTRVVILPQASPILVNDFYQCGFIDTMYLDSLEAISELPQGLQQAIKGFAKFANGKQIYIRFNAIPATSDTQELVPIM